MPLFQVVRKKANMLMETNDSSLLDEEVSYISFHNSLPGGGDDDGSSTMLTACLRLLIRCIKSSSLAVSLPLPQSPSLLIAVHANGSTHITALTCTR